MIEELQGADFVFGTEHADVAVHDIKAGKLELLDDRSVDAWIFGEAWAYQNNIEGVRLQNLATVGECFAVAKNEPHVLGVEEGDRVAASSSGVDDHLGANGDPFFGIDEGQNPDMHS